jgi:ribosomal protection tetracycline resistance protein
VTAISVFADGSSVRRASVSAGEIAKLWGLAGVRIGDALGDRRGRGEHHFPPPTMETVVAPARPEDAGRLKVALTQLAEQDPLIDVRQDDSLQELSVSLYGEVQKEVIGATLASEYGLEVTFREATPIYVERPVGTGEAVELLHAESNPFHATIGLRVEPAPAGSGNEFVLEIDTRTVPLYLYKTLDSFAEHMAGYVRHALREGLAGWRVTDCTVTLTRCAYSIPDGPPSRRGPRSTAADFRKLTPLVLGRALEQAGTVVCEPLVRAGLELPASSIGAVMPVLAGLGASIDGPTLADAVARIEAVLPAARVHELQQQLPVLTGGEGVLESTFTGYQPLSGDRPTRARVAMQGAAAPART